MSKWIVYGESSGYWDVGEPIEMPGWAAKLATPGEIAVRKICRVHKGAGQDVLNVILAAGENQKETQ